MGFWKWLKTVLTSRDAKNFMKLLLIIMWMFLGIPIALLVAWVIGDFDEFLGTCLALVVLAVNTFFSVAYLGYTISDES